VFIEAKIARGAGVSKMAIERPLEGRVVLSPAPPWQEIRGWVVLYEWRAAT
jgi:hypothetical protein